MKAEILAWLRESDKFVSGQELCNRFGVSRTAVWKVINQLKKEGYRIEAVQNKGYHMVSSPDLLSKYELESRLDTQWLGKEIVYKEVVGSTNAEVRKLAEDGAKDGLLVVADSQTQGKGRRGRIWQSPKANPSAVCIISGCAAKNARIRLSSTAQFSSLRIQLHHLFAILP